MERLKGLWISGMLPLYHEKHFTFRFADDRIIPRFHLEGVECGREVSVISIDSVTEKALALIARATVGEGGWVDLAEPIVVLAGNAFIAVPKPILSAGDHGGSR